MAFMNATSQSSILKVAVSANALSPQLASLLALQRAEEPGTVVILQEVSSRDLVCGLENGIYDIGIELVAAATAFTMSALSLWSDELALAVPLFSPLLAYSEVPLDVLQRYPLLQWSQCPSGALSQQVDACFGSENHTNQEVSSFDLMAALVAAGYGVGIGPRSRIVQAHGRGVAMRLLANGPYPIHVTLLKSPIRCALAIERFADRAAKVAATELA